MFTFWVEVMEDEEGDKEGTDDVGLSHSMKVLFVSMVALKSMYMLGQLVEGSPYMKKGFV